MKKRLTTEELQAMRRVAVFESARGKTAVERLLDHVEAMQTDYQHLQEVCGKEYARRMVLEARIGGERAAWDEMVIRLPLDGRVSWWRRVWGRLSREK